jgi:hypothetical protein
MKNTLTKIAGVGAVLLSFVVPAFAQTPTITALDPVAPQLVVNTAASVQATIIDMYELVWPYALTLLLISMAIAIGLRVFHSKR